MGCCVADAVPSRGGRAILDTAEVVQFEIALEEAARADESGVGRFIEPAAGTLNRALSNRHHLVFGRRGSGKTSLLQKARSELIANRRPNAFIDMEKYKAHTYPDVLISVVIETFQAISSWLNDAAIAPATKRSVWQKVRPKRGPLKRSDSHDIAQLLDNHVGELRTLLFAEDGATVEMLRRGQWSREGHFSAGLNAGAPGASGNVEGGRSQSASELNETHESVTRSKIDFLHRRVIDFQVTLRKVVGLSDENGFILLDDLYYIRKADQPDVLDYFHRLFKGSGLWLKVGTIRHRSGWYRHGDPPVGMKLGDDVEEIDLDLTLEKYNTAKAFLQRIANEIAIDSSVSLNSLVNEGARDRLVLASGGVARDYLSILRKSIPVAREQGRNQVNVAAVNQAAAEHEATKRDEFRRDVIDGESELESEFQSIRSFCFRQQANCFTVEKDLGNIQYERVRELVDLRLIHAIASRVTVRSRPGRIYEAFMLDISQYVGERKRRNFEILEFWRPAGVDKLRQTSLIYAEANT